MFRIPSYYDVSSLSFNEASEIITRHGRGDLLEGMKAMDRVWEEHCAAQRLDMDANTDDDFYDDYGYECSAYNIVFENMKKLFATAN